MNTVLGESSALPLYSQITIEDPGTLDLPEWETGEERVVATPHAIAVATRSDLDGDVAIVVLRGSDSRNLGTLVFAGELALTSSAVEVGNSLAAALSRIAVGRSGVMKVRVFVDPPDAPSTVRVLLAEDDV